MELELRYHLPQQHYKTILTKFPEKILSERILDNHYFDDEHLTLRRLRIGLRIRTHGNQTGIITLKYPPAGHTQGPRALKVRHEIEAAYALSKLTPVLQGKKSILALDGPPVSRLKQKLRHHRVGSIERLGALETRRTVLEMPRIGKMELDHCKVFNQTFYELEVETLNPKKTHRAIEFLLDFLAIPCVPATLSKLGRFLQEREKR